ncbi:TetR/AcrR family transcriptional regulator [Amycolatopsis japonica]
MTELPWRASPKAERILAATKKMVLNQGLKGITIADIAANAYVGKGTVYLYWATKEDLLVTLWAEDFLEVADEFTRALISDPDHARPPRLYRLLIQTSLAHPFVRAVQSGDDALLGLLARHPHTQHLQQQVGPSSMLRKVVPVWRRHRLARTDWDLGAQTYAARALLLGFLDVAAAGGSGGAVNSEDVLADTVVALLGDGQEATADDVASAAGEGVRLLKQGRDEIMEFMTETTIGA